MYSSHKVKRLLLIGALTTLSIALLAISLKGWSPSPSFKAPSLLETLGFITGAWCVWLTVEESIWNWPIGNINCAFYLVVFAKDRLFADMTLQGIYIVLGFLGWYWWLKGGENRTELKVSHTPAMTWLVMAVIASLATTGAYYYLVSVKDSAPFLDALTTVMSLCAQFLLTKKYIESWYVWISVDVVYIYLYWTRNLHLTSVLYALFIGLCVAGLLQWSKSKQAAIMERAVA